MTIFSLVSGNFKSMELIPQNHTCMGKDLSPALEWKGVPEKTESLAVTLVDPDAPHGDFIHWVLYNIPKGTTSLSEGMPTKVSLPDGSMQGINDFGTLGYRGPCPPPSQKHRYVFILYALDIKITPSSKMTYQELMNACSGHILAKVELIGCFSR